MKCYLHIGTEKTATTTIQSYLYLNRRRLLENSIIYTDSAGKMNNRILPVVAYDLNRRDDFTRSKGIDSNKKLEEFQKSAIRDLQEEIAVISKKKKNLNILFSSEHIQSRLTKIEEVERLKHVLKKDLNIEETSIIIYLRNPAEIANSRFSTAIKAGLILEKPPQPNNPNIDIICNHKKTLLKFGSIFGKSNVIPRIFHKAEFVNGSIIDDFSSVIGVLNDTKLIIPENQNLSLSIDGISILKRLNSIIPKFIDDKPNQLRANLVSYITKYFSDAKYSMPYNLYKKYDIHFKESNNWVRENYFPEKRKLFPEVKYPEETRSSLSEDELEKFAYLIANIWNDKQKQIIKLRKIIDANCQNIGH